MTSILIIAENTSNNQDLQTQQYFAYMCIYSLIKVDHIKDSFHLDKTKDNKQ